MKTALTVEDCCKNLKKNKVVKYLQLMSILHSKSLKTWWAGKYMAH